MEVRLLSHTTPSPRLLLEGITTPLDLIVYCARISNPDNQNNTLTSEKLLRYLIRNKHWSPLEMFDITLEIETTRDIARQILRHRSFSFQEFSQRYAYAHLGFEHREARLQDPRNRQNSLPASDPKLCLDWNDKQIEVMDTARKAYDWAILNGIAKEQARTVLPEGMTLTRLYMKGSLRSWIHYVDLRTAPSTQQEHRLVAERAASVISILIPNVFDMAKETV